MRLCSVCLLLSVGKINRTPFSSPGDTYSVFGKECGTAGVGTGRPGSCPRARLPEGCAPGTQGDGRWGGAVRKARVSGQKSQPRKQVEAVGRGDRSRTGDWPPRGKRRWEEPLRGRDSELRGTVELQRRRGHSEVLSVGFRGARTAVSRRSDSLCCRLCFPGCAW